MSFSATVVEVDIAYCLFGGGCKGGAGVRESTRLPPMWSGFKSRLSQHLIMLVAFKVGYLHCYERFSSRYSGLPLKNQHF